MSNSSSLASASQPGFKGYRAIEQRVKSSLNGRKRAESRFVVFGIAAIAIAVSLVFILFASVISKGLPAFWQTQIDLDIYFSPEVVQVEQPPVESTFESPAEYLNARQKWVNSLGFVNFNEIGRAHV